MTFISTTDFAKELGLTTAALRKKIAKGELNESVVRNHLSLVIGFNKPIALKELAEWKTENKAIRRYEDRHCEVCDDVFFANNEGQKYCSATCLHEGRKASIDNAKQSADYLKAKAEAAERYKFNRNYKAYQEKYEGKTFSCKHCQKSYTRAFGEEYMSEKYCTKECARDSHNKRRKDSVDGARYIVFTRDSFSCLYCGSSPALDGVKLAIDHVVPISKNGSEDISNLATCCTGCNSAKNDNRLKQEIETVVLATIAQRNKGLSTPEIEQVERVMRNIYNQRLK
jgi:hypothetical protein